MLCIISLAGSKPYKELKEVVERTGLVKDIQKLSPAHQTYSLESYHKICCFFATKFVHFFYLSMEGRYVFYLSEQEIYSQKNMHGVARPKRPIAKILTDRADNDLLCHHE